MAHSLHSHVASLFTLAQGLDLLQVAKEQGTVDSRVSAGTARPSELGPGTWGAPVGLALLDRCPLPVLPLQPLPLQAESVRCGGGEREGLLCHG